MKGLANFGGALKVLACTLVLSSFLTGCAALGEALDGTYTVTDAEGTTTEVPVGDIVANSAQPVGDIVGSLMGIVTGNPVIAAASAALIAALLAGARRKKAAAAVESTDT